MEIRGVTVGLPNGFADDGLFIHFNSTTDEYSVIVEFANVITLSTYSVNKAAVVDVSGVFRNGGLARLIYKGVTYATITVQIDGGVSSSDRWYFNDRTNHPEWLVAAGNTSHSHWHGSTRSVYCHGNSVELCQPMDTGIYRIGDFGDWYFSQYNYPFTYNLSGIPLSQRSVSFAVRATQYQCLRAATIGSLYSKDYQGTDYVRWLRMGENRLDPRFLYTRTATPVVGQDMAYEDFALIGRGYMVTYTGTKIFPTEGRYTISSLWEIPPIATVRVLPTPCYERMVWLVYTDGDGCKRELPVKVVEHSVSNGAEIYEGGFGSKHQDAGYIAPTSVLGTTRRTERLVVGVENATADLRLSELLFCDKITVMNDVGTIFTELCDAIIEDDEIEEPLTPTDITFRLRLI